MPTADETPDLPDVDDKPTEEPDDDAALDDDLDDAREGDEGGSEDDTEDADDEPLREEGKKALDRMKAANKELRKQLRDLKATVDELRNGDADEDADELTRATRATEAATGRAVAAEKKLAAKMHGLPDSWADRLKGDDLDDFLEDAEALAADMPTPQSRKGGGGAKDGHQKPKQPSLDDQITEAEKKGDLAEARRLKAQKVHQLRQAV